MDRKTSIVIACQDVSAGLRECLDALSNQVAMKDFEIILVDSSIQDAEISFHRGSSPIRWIKAPTDSLIPELWGIGARAASGQAVAFTTTQFTPAQNWLQQADELLSGDLAAVGGAIENGVYASLTQWAIFFTRYSAYMPPFKARMVEQIAGDNAVYARWVIDQNADLIEAGFWEHQINQRIRSQGKNLLLSPNMLVTLNKAGGISEFCRQRYQHGRIFGAERVYKSSAAQRIVRIVASPLIPFIFIWKIMRQVARKGRLDWNFIKSAPLQCIFVVCWSFGELSGYLSGDDPNKNRSANIPDAR